MIELVDNNRNKPEEFPFDRFTDFLPYANKDIKELCKEHEQLLVFPHSVLDADDRIGDSPIFSVEFDTNNKVRVYTGNIMGFIGVKRQRMKIRSRFDSSNNDYFLHYMLEKVFHLKFNLFNLHFGSDNDDILNILMFVFPVFLHKAIMQGIYREYRRFDYNDSNVRGTIDIARHISINIPFQGKVAYSMREHTADNNLMQLIRHTLEYILSQKIGRAILSASKDAADDIQQIYAYTQTYNKNERQRVLQKNLRPFSHPYYTAYRPLKQLCLQILRYENSMYADNNNEITGILFDGAWLWEEYVSTLLPDDFIHPKNKRGSGRRYLFMDNRGPRFLDYYKEGVIVLDAKYKRFEGKKHLAAVDRDDIHQLVTYMYMLRVKDSAFVYPVRQVAPHDVASNLVGYGGTMHLYGIRVCETAKDYEDFCNAMRESEKEFLNNIITIKEAIC